MPVPTELAGSRYHRREGAIHPKCSRKARTNRSSRHAGFEHQGLALSIVVLCGYIERLDDLMYRAMQLPRATDAPQWQQVPGTEDTLCRHVRLRKTQELQKARKNDAKEELAA